ncbi:hypothetical protein [Candidatus Phytoplasma melaleucae]|uniref:Secreted protein n=1 Tax=Candidatus Phytoplasma melaleucae TaxID=2982630 RepID=A0ABT9DDZ1_9MOLU|nr:hypothetical protein ['Melaleuca sp.' phytoplasma]MDO8168068.1 hypothetical protein ['Melaleuca sp.' phytoplasma]
MVIFVVTILAVVFLVICGDTTELLEETNSSDEPVIEQIDENLSENPLLTITEETNDIQDASKTTTQDKVRKFGHLI